MKPEQTTDSTCGDRLSAASEAATPASQVTAGTDLFAHQLFEAWARLTPHRVAVQAEEQQLTYAELNVRANQLAHYLLSCGAGNETLVAISLERSVDTVVAILAVLKAGAGYLPLDPTYPRARLSFMEQDARPRFLITREGTRRETAASNLRVISIDSEWSLIERESTTDPVVTIRPANLAYVIYTSGSTGNPKGVMITHGNLGHYVQSIADSLAVSAADTYLH